MKKLTLEKLKKYYAIYWIHQENKYINIINLNDDDTNTSWISLHPMDDFIWQDCGWKNKSIVHFVNEESSSYKLLTKEQLEKEIFLLKL